MIDEQPNAAPIDRELTDAETTAAKAMVNSMRVVEASLENIYEATDGLLSNFRILAQGLIAENERLREELGQAHFLASREIVSVA